MRNTLCDTLFVLSNINCCTEGRNEPSPNQVTPEFRDMMRQTSGSVCCVCATCARRLVLRGSREARKTHLAADFLVPDCVCFLVVRPTNHFTTSFVRESLLFSHAVWWQLLYVSAATPWHKPAGAEYIMGYNCEACVQRQTSTPQPPPTHHPCLHARHMK